jgi:two-component system sensor histidine kinase PilS (NtrC family)
MSENGAALKKKIQALIVIRVIFVTLLLGSSFLFRQKAITYIHELSYLIIALYIATIIYALLLVRIRNLIAFAYTQLMLDVVFATVLIYITGGIDSLFSFTLILTVISSSIVLNKKAGYVTATLSSILYGLLINFQFHGLLPLTAGDGDIVEERNYFYNIFVHIISLYLTAYLSGYLSSRLEKTEQKLEEKDIDLRDLEFFNRAVVEGLPSGLFTTDTSGTVLIFNRAAESITNTQKSAVIGKRIDSVLPYFSFPLSEGRRERLITVNGEQKIVGVGITTLYGIDEQPRGFIGIFQDLTQIKRLEAEIKQQEKMAAIGELSSNIAHEIRNPLASLKSSVEMLKEDKMQKDYKIKLMDIALTEMERLDRIIKDFLTYSRPAQPEFKKFDIHGLLDDIIELLKNIEQNKGHVNIKKAYHGIIEVSADPQKMRQVFWNLGLNAIESMPGGGDVTISTENMEDHMGITFKDSGSGIHEDDIEKIFFPFFTTKEHGTGLGLAIAYRIIEEHNGKIQVESNPDGGTTINILLPKSDGKE